MADQDFKNLFDEVCAFGGDVEKRLRCASTSHLFDGVLDEVSRAERREQIAENLHYAAEIMRSQAHDLDRLAERFRERARMCR